MFKAGDKVICIDDLGSAGKLVNGREYKVTGKSYCDSGDMFVFLSGFGDTNFFADRFKLKEKDMFTLEDIKEGYLVQERSGDLMLVQKNVRGDLFLTDFSNWNDLKLNYKRKELDVMKVYGLTEYGGCELFDTSGRKLLWERKETKEMTVAEIEKELGYSIKVVK